MFQLSIFRPVDKSIWILNKEWKLLYFENCLTFRLIHAHMCDVSMSMNIRWCLVSHLICVYIVFHIYIHNKIIFLISINFVFVFERLLRDLKQNQTAYLFVDRQVYENIIRSILCHWFSEWIMFSFERNWDKR